MDLLNKKTGPAEKKAAAGSEKHSKKTGPPPSFSVMSVVLLAAAVALLISSFLFSVLMVSGDSMEPGLTDGDMLLLVRTHSLESGDLVSFKWNGKTLLKRVIACPGDWVMIDAAGRVYVNGALLEEPYVSEFRLGESDVSYPFQVPENSYFVMGDERVSSLDSRRTQVGCVEYDQIIGKGVMRIWPLRSDQRETT
jgi:signal peptidase I